MIFGAGSNTSTGTAFGNSTSNNTFGGQSQQQVLVAPAEVLGLVRRLVRRA